MDKHDRLRREAMHGDQYVSRFTDDKQSGRIKRLLSHIDLPPDADVLDIGCGTGILADLLAPRYGTYTGVDFSQAMIQAAMARVVEHQLRACEFLCVDAVEVMRNRPESFDAIFMLDISEHIPDEEWAGIVDTARQSLRCGGKIYLHTPNLDFVVERLKDRGWMRQFPEHIAVRDPQENMRFFRESGYSEVACTKLPHYNVLRFLHPLSGIPVIGQYLAARLWISAKK